MIKMVTRKTRKFGERTLREAWKGSRVTEDLDNYFYNYFVELTLY